MKNSRTVKFQIRMHYSNYVLPFATKINYNLTQILNQSNSHYDASSDNKSHKLVQY